MRDQLIFALRQFLFDDTTELSLLFLLDELHGLKLISDVEYGILKPKWNTESHKKVRST